MVKFLDGPAAGTTLMLKRAPIMIRAVQAAPSGEWDALDQLHDEPAVEERIVIYRLKGNPGSVHLDYTEGGRRKGAWYVTAEYVVYPDQPGDQHTRQNKVWRAWCESVRDEVIQTRRQEEAS